MKQHLIRLGDNLLQRVLPAQEAGACVPENGQYCGCFQVSQNPTVSKKFYVNCTGTCAAKTVC